MEKSGQSKRSELISSVKNPLGLLALIVLVTEVTLGALASKAEGLDFTLLVGGMLVVMLGILFIVYKKPQYLNTGSVVEKKSNQIKYDLFIASPMASFETEAEYKKERAGVLSLINTIRKECKFKSIMYAGRDIESISDFDAPDISVREDFDTISESRYFAMILPGKLSSSVLVEAGAALAHGKPSIYFVKSRDDLPFLLGQSEMAFDSVKIYEYSTIDDINKLISKHRTELLPK